MKKLILLLMFLMIGCAPVISTALKSSGITKDFPKSGDHFIYLFRGYLASDAGVVQVLLDSKHIASLDVCTYVEIPVIDGKYFLEVYPYSSFDGVTPAMRLITINNSNLYLEVIPNGVFIYSGYILKEITADEAKDFINKKVCNNVYKKSRTIYNKIN